MIFDVPVNASIDEKANWFKFIIRVQVPYEVWTLKRFHTKFTNDVKFMIKFLEYANIVWSIQTTSLPYYGTLGVQVCG